MGSKPFRERFMEKVGPPDERGCRPWLASKDGTGYGKIGFEGRILQAHRVSWEFANGRQLRSGEMVLHLCDRPDCVAEAHLVVGDQAENMRQAFARGRVTDAQVRHANRALDKRRS